MQSEYHGATSHNLGTFTEHRTDLCADHHARPDAHRFATIFPLDVPKVVSVDFGDTRYEQRNDSDDLSRLRSVVAYDENTSTSRVPSVASTGQSSALSAAQRVIACYRAVHGSDRALECATMETREKGRPEILDDQRSMYTLAASTDMQSPMDMMWRPKPRVHMCRTDQWALMQAQSQAIAMMNDAGLKPANKIQCRRRGCADILPDVEALKYHIHIHNIADSATRRKDALSSPARKLSLVECSPCNSEAPRRNHSRSKSSLGTQNQRLANYHLPRKLSASSLLPSLFSPHEGTPEVSQIPTPTTVAKAFIPDPISNESVDHPPVRNNQAPSTHRPIPFCGRRKRKESVTITVGVESSPSTAMLLSPPTSPTGRDPLRANPSVPVALSPATDSGGDNRVPIPNKGSHTASGQLMESQSPVRTLSPARAMGPIRNGIKRILSIGCPDDVPNG